jgi:predicted nucleic acid-binding protein
MAAVVVSDSGILLSNYLSVPLRGKAKAILDYWDQNGTKLVAPTLFQYEIVAVIRKEVHFKRITAERGLRLRDALLAKPVQLYFDEALLKRAYEIATQYGRPTAYDTQYVALAERLGCDFWTNDQRLFNALSQQIVPNVYYLGNFSAT